MNFEWDVDNVAWNFRKHGVSFYEAVTILGDPLAVTYFDPGHSLEEQRFITLGVSSAGRCLVVAHTDRGENII